MCMLHIISGSYHSPHYSSSWELYTFIQNLFSVPMINTYGNIYGANYNLSLKPWLVLLHLLLLYVFFLHLTSITQYYFS